MKGVNSFDENGYWSRYSNDNWSVRKIYDDVLGYEYTLSGESFDALEVVDKLTSLEAENAKLKALIERLMEAGNDMTADCEASWYALHIPVCTPVVNWHALVDKYSASKDGGEK